ncbi:hypothetical protein [Paenibacillus sp. PL91]|uniref:hypothetical protein n=1 Tax=Paenibacillus sp. PL91 TaxID=2729538 RepID=UPI00145FA665|nr:hypothetical protein [Paenibacillus sp. PL91]MBC9199800.1 hypothetical protein [Paenibacillus sp. PL91]
MKVNSHLGGDSIDIVWTWGTLTISGVSIVAIVGLAMKYFAKSITNNYFNKKLESHKHDLQIMMEHMRFDFQRKTQDFILFTNKKHEKYAKIYDLYLRAESKVRLVLRNEFSPSKFLMYSQIELENYLRRFSLEESQLLHFLEEWSRSDDKKEIADKISDFLFDLELIRSRTAFNNAKNEFLLNRIYLSAGVTLIVERLTNELNNVLFTIDFFSNNKFDNQEEIHNTIMASINELTDLMKSELGIGYYDDSK